ncbi:unnamed protein product [Owenia fusiformis]|uniref:Nodulin-like domain-containing protein n=1 Tax=Owenia fusiformis TaxID=6347 RepID=A0A8S4Q5D0_OWEFU|nr:unnamed protein product [Owenia fusiformis]
MAICKFNQLRCLLVTSLIVGCFVKLWKGTLFNFNVYALALRDTFNYTQTDVNTISILTNMGISFGFPAGILHDKYGPRWTSFVGLVVTFAAYILIWSTSKSVEFYSNNAWLMKLYFFFIGQGTTFAYMTAFVTNLCNFDSKYRGKIVGLLDTFSGGSPSLFALIYATCFVNGHVTDDGNQNWPGYIEILIVGTTVTNFAAFLLLRVRPGEPDTDSEADVELEAATDKSHGEDTELVKADELANRYDGTDAQPADDSHAEAIEPTTNTTWYHKLKEEWNDFKGTLFDKRYLFLLFIKSFVTPIAIVFNTNITALLKAAGYEEYSATMTILFPLAGMGSRVIISFAADYFPSVSSRSNILLITNMGFIVAQGLLIDEICEEQYRAYTSKPIARSKLRKNHMNVSKKLNNQLSCDDKSS